MKVSEKAKEHLRNKNITEIFILPKIKVNYYGSACIGGTRREVEADILFDQILDDSYKTFDVDGIKVHVKERMLDGICEESVIDFKSGIFGERLFIANFDHKKVKDTTIDYMN